VGAADGGLLVVDLDGVGLDDTTALQST